MTVPLIILTIITLTVGWCLPGSFGSYISATGTPYHIHLNWEVAGTSIAIALCAIVLATWMYARSTQPVADKLQATLPQLHKWAYHRFYLDEVYQFVTHRIIFAYVSRPIAWFDRHIIDGFFNFLAWGTHTLSYNIRTFQSGRIQQYALVFLWGVIVLLIILLIP